MRSRWLLPAVFLSCPAAAEPAKPAWTPQGQWLVEFNDNECIANRRFARGSETMIIGLNPVPASAKVKLVVVPNHQGTVVATDFASVRRFEQAQLATGGKEIAAKGLQY
jgi:hypothetical protein